MEDVLASLDKAKHCLAFSSGLGATAAISELLASGDHIVCGDDVYGGTGRLVVKKISHFILIKVAIRRGGRGDSDLHISEVYRSYTWRTS